MVAPPLHPLTVMTDQPGGDGGFRGPICSEYRQSRRGTLSCSETPAQEMFMTKYGARSGARAGDGGECEVRRLAGSAEGLEHLQKK